MQAEAAAAERCGEQVDVGCLLAEVESLRPAYAEDVFERERIRAGRAQLLLAAGRTDEAQREYEQVDSHALRVEFLLAHAVELRQDGDTAGAQERLREAGNLLTQGRSRMQQLDSSGQLLRIGTEMAQAGAPDEARPLFDSIAGVRQSVPLNPLLLGLLLQVAKAQAESGLDEDAAALIADVYELALDQELMLEPSQVMQIFERWSAVDAPAADAAARELAGYLREDGPSAFEAGIWTGMAAGLAARKSKSDDAGPMLERARTALAEAPERAGALLLAPALAKAAADSGDDPAARQILADARQEAMALPVREEKEQVLPVLAQGLVDIGADDEARALVQDMLALAREGRGPHSRMLQHAAVRLQARLGDTQAVEEAVMAQPEGARTIMAVAAADQLFLYGDHAAAVRLLRHGDAGVAAAMMAGMAWRLTQQP